MTQTYYYTDLLNSLVSISIENTMSKELAAVAIVIAIISKRKSTEWKRKTKNGLGEVLPM